MIIKSYNRGAITVSKYFSLTAHAVNNDGNLEKYILQAEPLGAERHTADYLSSVIDRMLLVWNINRENVSIYDKIFFKI